MGSYGNQFYNTSYYLDSGDVSVKELRGLQDHYYVSSYPANAAYWQQGSIDKRFKVGDQTLYSIIYGDNQYYQARRFFFNLIMRHINMICGYQRKNRKSTVTVPLHDEDQLADDYNFVLKWCEDRDGFQEYFSQAFEGAVDTGLSLLHLYPSYVHDSVSGDLLTDQVAYCNFLIDPYFRKQDFSDCIFIWRRRWVNKTNAKMLLPGREKEIDRMNPSGMKDGRFPLQAELINLDTNKLFAYDEFHYRTTREATMIIDPKTGESVEWEEDGDDSEDMLKQTMQLQPWLQVKKMQVPAVKLVISLGSQPMYHGPDLLGIHEYPFIPLLYNHEPDIQSYMWRIQGAVRNLRDAQYLYNMRKVIEMDILQSQINSGWIYPVDAVTDPKAFRQSGQGFLIPLKAGHRADELQRIEAPGIPQSMIELSKILAEDITKISGVNEELLGAATDDKAGVLAMLRQGAGLVTLQKVFDKADYSQRLYGKLRLKAIKKNFTKGKITSILGREPDPRFFTTHSLKYNIAVEEGNYSTTQRQIELQQLLHFRELGLNITEKDILRKAFIADKKEIIKNSQEMAQQQQQQVQAQAAQQEKAQNADIMVKFAKAKSDLAREKEQLAAAQEHSAKVMEIGAESEHKKAQADLDLVKMMISLEDMDLQNIRNSLQLAQEIKMANTPQGEVL